MLNIDNTGPVVCVDLDGTLAQKDTGKYLAWQWLKKNPWGGFSFLKIFLWGGKNKLRHFVHHCQTLNIHDIALRQDLVDILKDFQNQGGVLCLATGAHQRTAQIVADHLGIFSFVIAAEEDSCTGENKAKKLVQHFGEQGFSYIGNAWVDRHVWKFSKMAIIVGGWRWWHPLVYFFHQNVLVIKPKDSSVGLNLPKDPE